MVPDDFTERASPGRSPQGLTMQRNTPGGGCAAERLAGGLPGWPKERNNFFPRSGSFVGPDLTSNKFARISAEGCRHLPRDLELSWSRLTFCSLFSSRQSW